MGAFIPLWMCVWVQETLTPSLWKLNLPVFICFFAALLSSTGAAKPLAPRRSPDSSADGPLFVWLCHVKLKTETQQRKRWEKFRNPIEGPTCSTSKHLGRCLDWNERSSSLTPFLEDQLEGNIWISEIPEGRRPNFAFFGHLGSERINFPREANASVDKVRCQENYRPKMQECARCRNVCWNCAPTDGILHIFGTTRGDFWVNFMVSSLSAHSGLWPLIVTKHFSPHNWANKRFLLSYFGLCSEKKLRWHFVKHSDLKPTMASSSNSPEGSQTPSM